MFGPQGIRCDLFVGQGSHGPASGIGPKTHPTHNHVLALELVRIPKPNRLLPGPRFGFAGSFSAHKLLPFLGPAPGSAARKAESVVAARVRSRGSAGRPDTVILPKCERGGLPCTPRGGSAVSGSVKRCWWPMKSVAARRINTARSLASPQCWGPAHFLPALPIFPSGAANARIASTAGLRCLIATIRKTDTTDSDTGGISTSARTLCRCSTSPPTGVGFPDGLPNSR